jgi:hypothetical protein
MANPKGICRIYFVSGGGTDHVDVMETMAALTAQIQPIGSPGIYGSPMVTYPDGSRVWINMHTITRIEPIS